MQRTQNAGDNSQVNLEANTNTFLYDWIKKEKCMFYDSWLTDTFKAHNYNPVLKYTKYL